jgi:hypothetical protein
MEATFTIDEMTVTKVAAIAECNPKTARAYLLGLRNTRSTTRHGIERALRELGLQHLRRAATPRSAA